MANNAIRAEINYDNYDCRVNAIPQIGSQVVYNPDNYDREGIILDNIMVPYNDGIESYEISGYKIKRLSDGEIESVQCDAILGAHDKYVLHGYELDGVKIEDRYCETLDLSPFPG